jgi:allophanate hydrolase subunit 1
MRKQKEQGLVGYLDKQSGGRKVFSPGGWNELMTHPKTPNPRIPGSKR